MTWQPGQSGNPGGRPKAKEWTEAIRKAVHEIDPQSPDKRIRLAALADALVAAGLAGDVVAMKEVGDRLEGKPTQIVGGDEDRPVVHEIRMVPVSAGQ